MSVSLGNISGKNGTGGTIPGGIQAADVSGTGAGPWSFVNMLADGAAGSNLLGITSVGAAKVDLEQVAGAAIAQGHGTAAAAIRVELPTDGTGVVVAKLQDGSGNALTSTGNALDVNLKSGGNSNGAALAANSAPTTNAPTTFRIAVTPTVTAGSYTAGNVLGGIMTFASILLAAPTASPTKWSGVLESISVKFKATAVTGEIDVAVFTASPSGGTYTDKSAPTWAAADTAKLVGIYALPTPESTLGTMTCYNLDGIGAAIDGASTSLFVVMTVKGTPTPASTTDVIVELGVLQG